MVKQVLFLLVTFGVLLYPMTQLTIVGKFVLHKKEIAATKCEQRKNPNNTCGGCCQLRKELKSCQKKNNEPCKQKNTEVSTCLFFESPTANIRFKRPFHSTDYFSYVNEYAYSSVVNLLKPPIC